MVRMGWDWDGKKFYHGAPLCWMGWEQLREVVWFGAGIKNLGDGDGMVIGGGTEIKVQRPSHPISMGIPSQRITT